MITAVDTDVLLDVFGADPTFGAASKEALGAGLDAGRLDGLRSRVGRDRGRFP